MALTFVVAAGSLAGHWLSAGLDATQRPLDWLGYVLIGIGAAALVARRRQATAVLAVAGVTVAAMFVLDIDHQGPFVLLPLLVALYTAAERGRRTAAIVTSTIVLGTFGLLVLLSPSRAEDGAVGLLWASGWIAAGIVTGEVVRNRRDYLRAVEDRAAEAERTREEEAQRRASEERLRIARELHDVLGHSLSLINVRAGVAGHVINEQPDEARDALETIRVTSKQALDELRATLGAFQHDDAEPAPRRPTPTVERLDELTRPIERAGVRVDVAVSGTPRPLPPALDRAVFRIVQESLTNVLRHADANAATVVLDHRQDRLLVEITDTGTTPVSTEPLERGRGIAGMRERAVAMGGRLELSTPSDGGLQVRAYLPLHTSDA